MYLLNHCKKFELSVLFLNFYVSFLTNVHEETDFFKKTTFFICCLYAQLRDCGAYFFRDTGYCYRYREALSVMALI